MTSLQFNWNDTDIASGSESGEIIFAQCCERNGIQTAHNSSENSGINNFYGELRNYSVVSFIHRYLCTQI